MTAFLEARAVSFVLQGRRLVDEVSLALSPGRLAIVIGPNGAGKSTLLKLLSGELRPHAGAVAYGGESIATVPPWRLACLRAVMTQTSRLTTAFTVYEVARFSIEFVGRALTPARAEGIVADSLAEAGVAHLADRDFTSLSGGEQQRARFAAALCQMRAGKTVAPVQALLLDEPIASLDLDRQLSLMDAARALAHRSDVAVLVVLHDLNIAAAYADDLFVMQGGRIVAQGGPAEVLTNDLVRRVFNVDLRVGSPPPDGIPFILPQHHAGRSALR